MCLIGPNEAGPHTGVIVTIPHHQDPARQPLLQRVRSVAARGDHDLLEKGMDVRHHQPVELRNGFHGSHEVRTRHLCGGSGQLNEQSC